LAPPPRTGPQLARRRRRQDNEEKLKKTNLRGYCQIKSNSGQLKSVPRHPDSCYVFCKTDGKPYKDIYSGFRLAVKRAGIEECTIHTLRHTVGSHLVMNGVDLATVKELLGHRDIQTTLRYAHLAQDHKREAIAKVAKLVVMDTYMDTKPQEEEKGLRLASVTP
jgi:integrase